MLKFKTSCAVLANLSSNLLNEVGLSLFRYFEVGLRVCDIIVNKFTFAISSPDEFLYLFTETYKYKYHLTLVYPDVVTDEFGNTGFWTLIYNQVRLMLVYHA